jgi:hypothetical protein
MTESLVQAKLMISRLKFSDFKLSEGEQATVDSFDK